MNSYGWIVMILAVATAAASPYTTGYDGDGAVTVNGNRTFIIGTYYHAMAGDTRSAAEQMSELEQTGFNLVHTGVDAAVQQAAADAGLMTWVTVGTLNLEDKQASAEKLQDAVTSATALPAVAILETSDEPAWTWKEAGARIPAQAFVEAYPIIKEIAPNYLLYTNHAPVNLVSTMQAYNPGTDIVACDIYPVNPGNLGEMYALNQDGHQGDLNSMTISQVGEYMDKMRQVAGPHRPVFMVLQGFAWEMLKPETERVQERVLYPTHAQSRFMAFQSIIRGANGIVYWGTGYTPHDSAMWSDLKRVVREVADLAAPLATPTVAWPLTLEYREMGHSVDAGVQTMVKQHDGTLYLFTCNADKNPCQAEVHGLHGWTSAEVLGEDRTAPVQDGVITETWQPFAVHIYRLSRV